MTEKPITVQAAQISATQTLAASGIKRPGFDVRLLLAGAMDIEMSKVISMSSEKLSEAVLERFSDMIAQRAAGKPAHRILGYREFFGRRFDIGPHSLEPRPETELLIERILEDFKRSDDVSFLEIGVGSGAIIVTLLSELAHSKGIGADISTDALKDAASNAERHNVFDKATFVQSDCFDKILGKFDFIVSNPPYIPSDEINKLSQEVREHDPMLALDGGADGLDIYRKILEQGAEHLNENGRLYLETGYNQHEDILRIANEMGWGILSTHLDLSGLERIVVLQTK